MNKLRFLLIFLFIAIACATYFSFIVKSLEKEKQKTVTYAIYNIYTDDPAHVNVGIGTALDSFYIAMTYHQLQDIKNMSFIAKNFYIHESFSLEKITTFPELDLVILKSKEKLPFYYNIESVANYNLGDIFYAIGVNNLITDFPIMTQGSFVSLVTNEISSNPPILNSMIVCDAKSNSGFSGGALLSRSGNCLGIVSGRLFPDTGEESLALYSIRSDYIYRALRNRNIKTYYFAALDFTIIRRFNALTNGYTARINKDFNDKIKEGDEIISIDGLNFYTESDFFYLLSTVFKLTKLSVLRKGKLIEVKICIPSAN